MIPERFVQEKSKIWDESATGEGTRASKLYEDALKAGERCIGATDQTFTISAVSHYMLQKKRKKSSWHCI